MAAEGLVTPLTFMVHRPAALFAFVVGAVCLVQGALAIGLSRQWYCLPVVFGLTALGGFLLNPFADANTAPDLRAAITDANTLVLLCIAQLILGSLSLWFGIGADSQTRRAPPRLGLVIVHAIPAPVVLIAMLLIEQSYLSATVGARPETVGVWVGLAIATLLAGGAAVALSLPRRPLSLLHRLASVGLILACMFAPALSDPLPRAMTDVDWISLGLLWKVGLAGAILVALGSYGEHRRVTGVRSPLGVRHSLRGSGK